jgi:hypothetical protein
MIAVIDPITTRQGSASSPEPADSDGLLSWQAARTPGSEGSHQRSRRHRRPSKPRGSQWGVLHHRGRNRPRSRRLLAGTPLRSATGKLTGTELIAESGLRRDVVYGDHKDLVEEFQARVKAQRSTPLATQDLAAERDTLAAELAAVRQELARERSAAAVLRKIAAELALELHQARAGLASNVTQLPPRKTEHT